MIFLTSVKGVIKANELLVPMLIVFLVIIGFINIIDINIVKLGNYITRTNQSNYILSAIIYASYNSILVIPVLITLKKYINTKLFFENAEDMLKDKEIQNPSIITPKKKYFFWRNK